jgi:stage III sporulation protein AF
MMSYIGEWIKHIVLLILMATFLDLILPNSSMRKYVKLVVGFLLILLILSPILKLFSYDQERLLLSLNEITQQEDRPLNLQVEREKEKIEEMQEQAVMSEVSEKWSREIKTGIESQFDLQVNQIGLGLESDDNGFYIQQLTLLVEQNSDEEGLNTKEASTSSREMEVEPIQPVIIRITDSGGKVEDQEKVSDEQKKIQEEVLAYLKDEWNISVDKISFSWTRG